MMMNSKYAFITSDQKFQTQNSVKHVLESSQHKVRQALMIRTYSGDQD